MKIPEEALKYFLGEGYAKMRIPEAVEILRAKGVLIKDKVTLAQFFTIVKKEYAERIREQV